MRRSQIDGVRGSGAVVAALLLLAAAAAPAPAEGQESVPRFPFGTPVAFVPVQSVQPLPGGGWPGGADAEEETLRTMDAELAFALAGTRGAAGWALPDDVVRRVERNPTLRVDPRRLAYQGLLEKPDLRRQIYEPLHGELRAISALFDTRYVVLPISLRAEPAPGATDAASSAPDAAAGAPAAGRAPVRARLLLAMIDIRSSAIAWYGEIAGDPAPPDSPALLATLAERVADLVAPS
jgi:hypothetical protein